LREWNAGAVAGNRLDAKGQEHQQVWGDGEMVSESLTEHELSFFNAANNFT
jgi:hypothetical protein